MTAAESARLPRTPAGGPRSRPLALLLLGAWFALLTAAAELALLAVQKFGMGRMILQGGDVIWMAPLANLIFFGALGAGLLAFGRLRGRQVSARAAVASYATLGGFAVLLMYPSLHRGAAFLLAAGVGVQTARLVADRAWLDALARRGTAWLLGLALASGVGVRAWRAIEERRELAGLPEARPGAPNVLLIVLDTVRAISLSAYGHHRPTTPELERLAARGVRFAHAFSTAPWTLPSHATMFTGQLRHELSTTWTDPLDATYPTLAEHLSARGYLTAGFVANLLYCTAESGLARGFVHYEDHAVSPGQVLKSASLGRTLGNWAPLRDALGYHEVLGRKTAARINADFLGWLSRQPDRPFFAFLNYYDAHNPYLPPAPYDSLFGARVPRPDVRLEPRERWTDAEVRPELAAYEGAIAYLDHQLGRLFAALEERGLLENTLVIVTSDHGEEFNEHGYMGHGHSLYRASVEVPLIMAHPGRVPAGEVVTEPVSLRDLPATVVDLLAGSEDSPFPGRTLRRFWDPGSGPGVEMPILSEVRQTPGLLPRYPVSHGDLRSLLANGYRMIRNPDGRLELYDFRRDPGERHDLAATARGRELAERHARRLEHLTRRQKAVR